MKNRIGLIGAWVLATALAMGVASQAVGLVADRADEIPVQVPIAVAGPASFDSSTSSLPPTTTLGQPSTTLTTTSSTTTTTAGSGATTTTLSPVATLATTTTTTTVPPPPPLDSGSFVATGGRVTVACTGADTITLLGTSPVGGWSVDVESSGPEKVRVDFESGEEESEIKVVCVNGQLQADIED